MMLFGYQAVYDEDFFDAIAYASKHGFAFVSFDLHVPRFAVERLSTSELDNVRQCAERHGVALAFHLPGDNVSLYADYPAIRAGIRDHFAAVLHATEQLQARHVTIHTGSPPSLKQAHMQEDAFLHEHQHYYSEVLYENLRYLSMQTRQVLLCVENYQFTPLTMQTVARLLNDDDRLYLTWDIAKNYGGKPGTLLTDVVGFMWQHSHRIREVHAHDLIENYRSHQIIGDGMIDFTEYASVLKRHDVAITIEVRPREAATLSRDRLAAVIDGPGERDE